MTDLFKIMNSPLVPRSQEMMEFDLFIESVAGQGQCPAPTAFSYNLEAIENQLILEPYDV